MHPLSCQYQHIKPNLLNWNYLYALLETVKKSKFSSYMYIPTIILGKVERLSLPVETNTIQSILPHTQRLLNYTQRKTQTALANIATKEFGAVLFILMSLVYLNI